MALSNEENSEYIQVEVISRPVAKNNEKVPRNSKGARHLAIVSDVLPHGLWEMGPDENGMITTSDTVSDLSSWPTYQLTQKSLELGGDYIRSMPIEVNKKGLLDAIQLYEASFSGKQKYSFRSYNENYAVENTIYGAGAELSKTVKQKLGVN